MSFSVIPKIYIFLNINLNAIAKYATLIFR
jgi:hypothetical protein